jgi:hypothetical protein
LTAERPAGKIKKPRKGRALLQKGGWPLPLRREVMLMGNGRWAKALRFVVCFVIILTE